MSNINLLANLSDYKAYATARGQTATTDTTDDGVVVDLLEKSSRDLEDWTLRQYHPTIETRLYDVPEGNQLWLDEDLLAVITLTNGDGTVITSGDYILQPANLTPKYCIELKDSSSVTWQANSSGSNKQVISLLGWWGYRKQFTQRAWALGGTLGAALNASSTSLVMTAGHSLTAGHIIKIDSEILNLSATGSTSATALARGDNGSTAAAHDNGSSVYIWKPQEEAKGIVLELANGAYQRRFGKVIGESATVTAAGVVLSPRGISQESENFIKSVQRLV